jgi:FkbM family methyltransferase
VGWVAQVHDERGVGGPAEGLVAVVDHFEGPRAVGAGTAAGASVARGAGSSSGTPHRARRGARAPTRVDHSGRRDPGPSFPATVLRVPEPRSSTATPPRRTRTERARQAVAKGREIRAQSRYQFRRHLPDLVDSVVPGPVWALFPYRLVGAVLAHRRFTPASESTGLARFGNYLLDPRLLSPDSVVYSVGLGGNASFDEALATTVGCEVHVFDPTPGVADFGRRVAASTDNITFHPVAMWMTSGDFPMAGHPAPGRTLMKSGSLQDQRWGDQHVVVPALSFADALAQLGHARVDVLKADIEGGALPLVESVLAQPDPPDQIAVEFEVPLALREVVRFVRSVRRVAAQAAQQGYDGTLLTHKRGRGLEVLLHRPQRPGFDDA